MFAPSLMFLLNRKRSPKVEVLNTSIEQSERDFQKPATIPVLTSYPNPFNPSVTIQVNPIKTGNYHFDIISVTGQLIYSSDFQLLVQNQQAVFPVTLSGKASGLYLVRLWFQHELIQTQKITLIK
jgi:hypothetical protein